MATTSHTARTALMALLLGSAPALGAQDLALPQAAVTQRQQWLASFDRMPVPDLAEAFLRCDREAWARVLGFEEGVRCAMAWDALLGRVFAGDVDALIAWWRVHRDESAVD